MPVAGPSDTRQDHTDTKETGTVKKLSILAAAAAMIAISAPSHAQDSALKKILETGVLKFGTTGDWNPMSIRDAASGDYKGFDIDIATELANDLGVKLEFVKTDWKTLVNGVIAGQYDITSSASLNPGRAKVAGYSESYFELASVPITHKETLGKFNDWDDINKAGVTVATTSGTVQEPLVKRIFPNATIKVVEAPARDFQEVLAKRADVHVTSNVEAATLVEKYSQLAIIPVKEPVAPTPVAMLMPQADQVWINYVNHWIKLKKARGFFKQTAEKWGLATQ
jgi:cyclohexadienyl dehydratase